MAAGLTQTQLAERAGLHLHGLTKLEQGDREPSWVTVLDLARALGVGCAAFEGTEVTPIAAAAESTVAVPEPRGRPRKDVDGPAPPPAKKGRRNNAKAADPDVNRDVGGEG